MNAGVLPVFVTKCKTTWDCFPLALPFLLYLVYFQPDQSNQFCLVVALVVFSAKGKAYVPQDPVLISEGKSMRANLKVSILEKIKQADGTWVNVTVKVPKPKPNGPITAKINNFRRIRLPALDRLGTVSKRVLAPASALVRVLSFRLWGLGHAITG
jgi:hypothetical protein